MVIIKKKLKKQVFDLESSLENYRGENKKLNKKRHHIKNTLFNFRQSCYGGMVVINSELVLINDAFNKLFDKLIIKFRKEVENEVNI